MGQLGIELTKKEAKALIYCVDTDLSGTIGLNEFIDLIYQRNPILDKAAAGLEVPENVTMDDMRKEALRVKNELTES